MKNSVKEILIGVSLGLLVFWIFNYNQKFILGIHTHWYLAIGSFFGVLLLIYYFRKEIIKSAALITLGVLVTHILRIIYDVLIIDAVHPLLAFEIFDTLMYSFFGGVIGGFISLYLRRPRQVQE